MDDKRGNFGSHLAGVLVVAGSAVGLGNIWRFSFELGKNGGAIFLLLYVICIVFIGIPLIVSEFAVGRNAQSNTARAFGLLGGSKSWQWVGFLGLLTGTLILCYYGVVAGWAFQYLLLSGFDDFAGKTTGEFVSDFNTFVSHPWQPIVCMILFMMVNLAMILAGVKKGIERGSKVMMPVLFILIVLLAVSCLWLPDANKGLAFMFKLDVSHTSPATFLSAMGQCFFSLSLCMGCICTYASYFRREDKLVRNAVNAAVIDTVVAILAGVIIFVTAFSVGIEPDAGPSLVFITLPNVFQQVFANHHVLCYIFSLMFYLLLFIATLTSAMGLLEAPTIYLKEEFHIRRRNSSIVVTLLCIALGTLCSLSMGPWASYTIAGMNIFDIFDSVTAKILLPVGGIFLSLYTGWFCDKEKLYNEVTNYGTVATKLFPIYRFLIRYLVPLAIIAVFLNQLGLL